VLKKELSTNTSDYVIVIAEDGSTDGSDLIAAELARHDNSIVHVHADRKLGRGLALMNVWGKYKAEIYSYIDCDLATDMVHFPQLIQYIEEGYDLSTGSRYVKGSMTKRPFLRGFTSKIYNFFIRLFFKTGVQDHQCGFKAFSRKFIEFLLENNLHDDWFWDTEVIVLAKKGSFKLIEFPVSWEEKKGQRTPLKRLINDIGIHGKGILRLLFS
jgi:glycosyltransferase involved in cell wall biosynthesis